ncbi:uncharacterized protein THITE_2111970 [Thermothielavioides terrestris NRRL 8126]|uniref:Uncharacterized protein n=1 Tax=Thermothielavioides terrestris (strain ATCC 38088 / NRRL 8126) TaxID=578455 RepID=G2R456_THETT|nr:uncharacterized protein THITE_2111970 [Thermothielavioides terrestris NRRL 8126]AEO65198.1 hypothetical protein THITE_2111970 [Thermothielavioides terrestris NRRL 8126]
MLQKPRSLTPATVLPAFPSRWADRRSQCASQEEKLLKRPPPLHPTMRPSHNQTKR